MPNGIIILGILLDDNHFLGPDKVAIFCSQCIEIDSSDQMRRIEYHGMHTARELLTSKLTYFFTTKIINR